MIEKFLNKLGYIKVKEIGEEKVCEMMAGFIGDPTEYSVDKKQELQLFNDLAGVDGFRDYLRDMQAKDLQRYVGATDDKGRHLVMGALMRTSHIRKMLKESPKAFESTKLPNLRYDT